jgi:hypothetical protein
MTDLSLTSSDVLSIMSAMARRKEPPAKISQVFFHFRSTLNGLWSDADIKVAEKILLGLDTEGRNLAQEVTEWVAGTTGNFLSSDLQRFLNITERADIKNLSMILKRLSEEGMIEKYGERNGSWRRIDRSYVEQCWWDDDGQPLPVSFPLGVGDFAKVYHGATILLEGQKSQGKSAFALEFSRLNAHLFSDKVLYQNVEMTNTELTDRVKAYGDVYSPEQWRRSVTFIRQTSDWWDKIQPDGLNVVDYLIEYKESYLIADFIWRIHQKLKSGIALVIVQRDPLKPYPVGGRGVRDIPRLILSLVHHKIKIEDVKSYHNVMGRNPSGLSRKFKLASWWRFVPASEWDFAEDEKYEGFVKDKKKPNNDFVHEP